MVSPTASTEGYIAPEIIRVSYPPTNPNGNFFLTNTLPPTGGEC